MNLIITIIVIAFIGAIPLSILKYQEHERNMKEIEERIRKVIEGGTNE